MPASRQRRNIAADGGLVGVAAERHRAEAQPRHLHARAAEGAIFHANPLARAGLALFGGHSLWQPHGGLPQADHLRTAILTGFGGFLSDCQGKSEFCGYDLAHEHDSNTAGGSMKKSTIEEIRQRFDADVERLRQPGDRTVGHGGHAAGDGSDSGTLPRRSRRPRLHVLDIGCGAGDYTLKLARTLARAQRHPGGPQPPHAGSRPAADLRSHDRGERHLPSRPTSARYELGEERLRHHPGRGSLPSPAHRRRIGAMSSPNATPRSGPAARSRSPT